MKKVLLITIPIIILLSFAFVLFFVKDIYVTNLDSDISVEVFSENNILDKTNIKIEYCSILFKLNCVDISDKLERINDADLNTLGDKKIEYKIEYNGKIKNIEKSIKVVDTTPPKIELKEAGLSCPNMFIEPGYTVTDNYSKDLDDKVIIKRIDTTIYYTVSDSSGNETTVERKLEFGDKEAPKIVLKGHPTEYVLLGKKYTEPGYTVTDNCDSNVKNKVSITGSVDTSKVGTYTINYKVEDSSKNVSTATRKVKVYESKNYTTIIPQSKVIYLTFDDGPGAYTEELLNVLKKYDVKATFFVTNQFSKYSYLIKREYDEGHAIGVHSYTHSYKKIYSSVDSFFNDIEKMNDVIYSKTGVRSKLLRFPGGSSNTVSSFNKGIMTILSKETDIRGYKYFDWNVSSNDTATSDKNKIYNNVIKGVKSHNFSIVLQHDIKKNSVAAVEDIIIYGLDNGYTFLPLDLTSPTAHHGINN